MAFSFNWSGLQVPQMQRRDTSAQAIKSAGEFGRAARGYVDRRDAQKAADEYANIIDRGSNENAERIRQIEDEIARLEAENASLMQQVQPNAGVIGNGASLG